MGKYKDQLAETRKRPEYWDKVTLMEFIQGILGLMKEDGVSKSALAREYGAEPPYITNALAGRDNFTVHTMNKLAGALDAAVHIAVVRKDNWVHWETIPKSDSLVELTPLRQEARANTVGNVLSYVDHTASRATADVEHTAREPKLRSEATPPVRIQRGAPTGV